MKTDIPEPTVRYWSKIMADRFFESEQDARNEVFRICERHSRQSWSTPEGKVTIPENRAFANSLPLYQEGDQWKVGRPLTEYLTMTPDFADGTSGDSNTYAPDTGDAGTAVGLPDYKYLERKKHRHEKLRALMQRRDPARAAESRQIYRIIPGKSYWFEYRCWESDSSQDAELWYRSHRRIKVLKMEERGFGSNEDERAQQGQPAAFKIKFDDGFTATAMEDELLDSPEHYINKDPPPPPHLREQHLSAEEMAILKRQTRPRRRLRFREDEEDLELHKDVTHSDPAEIRPDETAPDDVLIAHLRYLGYQVEEMGAELKVINPETSHYLVVDISIEDPQNLEDLLLSLSQRAKFEEYWQALFGGLEDTEVEPD